MPEIIRDIVIYTVTIPHFTRKSFSFLITPVQKLKDKIKIRNYNSLCSNSINTLITFGTTSLYSEGEKKVQMPGFHAYTVENVLFLVRKSQLYPSYIFFGFPLRSLYN